MAALLQTKVDLSLAKGRNAMNDAHRDLLNLRVIRTTFHVATESHPESADAAAARATMLLAQLRQRVNRAEILDAIAAVQAEVEGRAAVSRVRHDRCG